MALNPMKIFPSSSSLPRHAPLCCSILSLRRSFVHHPSPFIPPSHNSIVSFAHSSGTRRISFLSSFERDSSTSQNHPDRLKLPNERDKPNKPEPLNRWNIFLSVLGVGLVGLGYTRHRVRAVAADGAGEAGGDGKKSPSSRWNFIADVVEKSGPAVVYIEKRHNRGHFVTGGRMVESTGSGFIIRSDGLILTSAHVVGNSRSVHCRLQDGRTFEGFVQAFDPISDLATIKVSATNLPTLQLGDSGRLRPGEWVVAMGSPFSLSNTVTVGIVSSAERGSRELGIHNNDINYIQTDATISFGNSGGPLVNLDGEAIGINTMMVTSGISFAIPSNYAKTFIAKAEAIEKRSPNTRGWFGTKSPAVPTTVQREGYIGITMLSLSAELIRALRARHADFPDVEHGVLVHRVMLGSPAHSAGVQPGDIIVRINEVEVREAVQIYNAIESSGELAVTIRRGTETLVVRVIPEAAR